jgi:chitodextrinase
VIVLTIGVAGWFVLSRPGPSPQSLAASTVTSTTVSLAWSRPSQGPSPQRYVVHRNGKEIARVGPEATYRDSGLSPMTNYRYRVLALVDGDLSAPTKNVVVKTRPTAPTGVTSSNVTTTSMVISWSAPSGTTPDRYVVLRDGSRLATVPADTLTYKDSSLAPVTDVSYTIIAVIEGQESDPSAPLRATTLAPPVQDARLQGPWNLTLTVTRAGGTRLKVGARSSESWTFTPRCSSGACPVNLSGTVAGKPFTMILTRSGAVYRGTTKARVAKCVNADVASTLTLALRVSAGTVKTGTWAVSNWTGSLDLAIPYTVSGNYYCPAQSATFKVTPDSAAAQSQT